MRGRTRRVLAMLAAIAVVTALATACAGEEPPVPGAADGEPPTLPTPPDGTLPDELPDQLPDAAPDQGREVLPSPGGSGGEGSFGEDFDRDEARERAEALLGVAEVDLPDTGDVRVIRRGDERPPVTMDLRVGRRNVELDADADGTFRVVLVQVEVPDDQPPLIVE